MAATDGGLVLECRGISKSYPGVQALDYIDFEIREGEILGLVGENGAGKSTLIKIIAGATRADAGEILWYGKPVRIHSPLDARNLGISVIHQELVLAPYMTVSENILLGCEKVRNGLAGKLLGVVDRKAQDREAQETLGWLGADFSPSTRVSRLTVAQQQKVEIAKALFLNAHVIVMDEPTSSLEQHDVEQLFNVIKNLKQRGVTIVFVSHRLQEILEITDRVIVLRDGKRVGEAVTGKTTRDELVRMMVGRSVYIMAKTEKTKTEEVVLQVKALSTKLLKNITFHLNKGEILGFAGLVGSGRTELAHALFGSVPCESGEIRLNGNRIFHKGPSDAIKNGIGFVTEDRRAEGLVPIMTFRENVTLPSLEQCSRFMVVQKRKEVKICKYYRERLGIRIPSYEQKVKNLSGGNQQKVILAKWLALTPSILILDEPTRGIDIGAKEEFHKLILDLARDGVSIILISSELLEVLNLSDRILVMAEGKIAGEFLRDEATQEKILQCCHAGA